MDESSPTEDLHETVKPSEFKKPVLIGRIGKLPKKATNENKDIPEEKPEEKVLDDKPECKIKNLLPPAVLLKEISTPIPYKEPKWSGLCPDGTEYALEVLKSGMIVEKVDLSKKPFFVFGRLANCDVIMMHPTISRHHAVIQYKAFTDEGEQPSGWYLFDLGSTHGTFLNKDRLKPNHYTRVRVGHQIKFGNSTRTYIVLGPDFDSEGESDLTVTEIKKRALEMKLDRDRMIQEAIEQREKDKLEEERKREEQGIDWGMGEDAEEEPDLADNPFASTGNEELYLEDPKKTLRGYFEREGHELQYDCEERGTGQYVCRVELPIDDARGRPVMAEVSHRGKKKEAVIACALEACRILDRAGLLRQAKHESRRKKARDWSADDYYDSDEDTFLDRTGSVEKKRNKRMERLGAAESKDKALTYDDLLKQVSDIEAKIVLEEKNLERLRAKKPTKKQTENEDDALDAFMATLSGPSMADKAEISRTKMTIQKLKSELSKTQRLADIARPAHVPPLVKKSDSASHVKMVNNSVVYGKRLKLKEDSTKRPKVRGPSKQEEREFVEEMDSDDETTNKEDVEDRVNDNSNNVRDTKKSDEDSMSKKTKHEDMESTKKNKTSKEDLGHERNDKSIEANDGITTEVKKMYGPMRPPENYVIPDSYFDQETDRDLPEIMEDE